MLRESLSDLWHAKDCWTIELYRPSLRFHWRYRVHSVRSDHQRGTSNYDGFAAAGRYGGSSLFAGSYCQWGDRALYWELTAGALPAGLSLDSASCPSIPSDAPPLGTS